MRPILLQLPSLFLLSVAVGFAAIFAPQLVNTGSDGLERALSFDIAAVFTELLLLTTAIVLHRRRGLVLLVSLPLALYRPALFAFIYFVFRFGLRGGF